MTQKDYQKFASLVQQMPPRIKKDALISALALLFAFDNPRFNRERFIAACTKEPKE